MARWPINGHPIIVSTDIAIILDHILIGMLLNQLQSAQIVYRWVYRRINCNQLGLYIDEHPRWVCQQWVVRLFPLGHAGLLTSAKQLTAQTRGFYDYQPRGFNGLVVKQTHCFTGY
jgi:hypothetical protein